MCTPNAILVARLHFQKVKSICIHTTVIKDCFLFHGLTQHKNIFSADAYVCVYELNAKFARTNTRLKYV